MGNLTNAELMILQVIKLLDQVSGYRINAYVDEMGSRKWADIGKTSIYSALKKLETKELVTLFVDIEKKGKGPSPKNYSITAQGIQRLQKEMLNTIETARERDKRLDLVLFGIEILSTSQILSAFKIRGEFLKSELDRILIEFEEQQNCINAG